MTLTKSVKGKKMNKLDIAKLLIQSECVALRPKDPFTYASGLKGPIYCDNRLLLGYPDQREKIAQAFSYLIEQEIGNFDRVAGLATAGIPHAAWVCSILNLPMIYIRSKPKGHGKGNQVEGPFVEGDRVILIEDLVNQAKSLEEAVIGAREEGLIVSKCYSIVDYEMEKAQERMKNLEIDLISLTDFSHIVMAAFELGFINSEEQAMLEKWQKNPEAWC